MTLPRLKPVVIPAPVPHAVISSGFRSTSGAPPVPELGVLFPPRSSVQFSSGRVESSGRVQDRSVITALGWVRGDRLLMTVVGTSAIVQRRPDGVFAMTAKPYLVLPAVVRARCRITTGTRVLLAADPSQDMLVVHPPEVVAVMLAGFHADLAAGGAQ